MIKFKLEQNRCGMFVLTKRYFVSTLIFFKKVKIKGFFNAFPFLSLILMLTSRSHEVAMLGAGESIKHLILFIKILLFGASVLILVSPYQYFVPHLAPTEKQLHFNLSVDCVKIKV